QIQATAVRWNCCVSLLRSTATASPGGFRNWSNTWSTLRCYGAPSDRRICPRQTRGGWLGKTCHSRIRAMDSHDTSQVSAQLRRVSLEFVLEEWRAALDPADVLTDPETLQSYSTATFST